MDPQAYRLPRHVLPRQYDVTLDARLDRPDFRGHVAIRLEIVESAPAIELHAQDLTLSNARLNTQGTVYPGEITPDTTRDLTRITFGTALPAGKGTLDLDFQGQIVHGLEGLYLAEDGDERMLCTHCEPTNARRIFPCFDEPTFKACLAWEVTTAADATVLTNGPLVRVTPSADETERTWTFAPTKPISPYLAAMVIGPLASTPEAVVANTPLRVWATTGKEPLGAFAQAYTARLLPWYEEYFGIPYHWEKLDQVAVPGFAWGAMENVGLVVFRQTLLLMNPQTAGLQEEKEIAFVVAHEFAHMWFGDLVTMQWWDDIWLNEAFAEWLAFQVVDALSPEYEVWDYFQTYKMYALVADALTSTHPIYSPVATPADARELFDAITYEKGCAVLRMLHHFLGDAAFGAGLRDYLRRYAESNATGDNLWSALQTASDKPVVQFMNTWITQGGYPLIQVALEGDSAASRLDCRQQRFYASPLVAPDPETLWPVPLVIRYEDSAGIHETNALLAERRQAVPLPVTGELAWCYANAGEVGFYRQQPDAALLSGLIAHLDHLAPGEQVGLLGDQWALVGSGHQAMRAFLDLLGTAVRGDHYQVLTEVVRHLHTLEDLLEESGDTPALASFRTWVDSLFKDKMAGLGFAPEPGEARSRTLARVPVVDALTTLAHNPVALAAAQTWAAREATDPASVDPNLAPILVAATAQQGDAAVFERYVEIYQQRKAAGVAPQETDRYLHSFSKFEPPELTARTLGLLDTGIVPLEGMPTIIGQMFEHARTRPAAWEYVKAHWRLLETAVPSWIPGVVAVTGQLSAVLRPDMVSFFEANLHGEARLSYAHALEELDQRAEFKTRTQDDLLAWFHSRDS